MVMDSAALSITILTLGLLIVAGALVHRRLGFLWALCLIIIPLIMTAADYFIPGDQTLFRQLCYIVYAFFLYTLAIFSKRKK